jgi:hypothetical protein
LLASMIFCRRTVLDRAKLPLTKNTSTAFVSILICSQSLIHRMQWLPNRHFAGRADLAPFPYALTHPQLSFVGPCERISHHAVRRWAMLLHKPLFGFAASTSTLTVLMVLLGQVG